MIQGTSMATPHIARATALLLAQSPTLDSARINALVRGNAAEDSFSGPGSNNTSEFSQCLVVNTPPVPNDRPVNAIGALHIYHVNGFRRRLGRHPELYRNLPAHQWGPARGQHQHHFSAPQPDR